MIMEHIKYTFHQRPKLWFAITGPRHSPRKETHVHSRTLSNSLSVFPESALIANMSFDRFSTHCLAFLYNLHSFQQIAAVSPQSPREVSIQPNCSQTHCFNAPIIPKHSTIGKETRFLFINPKIQRITLLSIPPVPPRGLPKTSALNMSIMAPTVKLDQSQLN